MITILVTVSLHDYGEGATWLCLKTNTIEPLWSTVCCLVPGLCYGKIRREPGDEVIHLTTCSSDVQFSFSSPARRPTMCTALFEQLAPR